MSNLPGPSLESRFWDKDFAVTLTRTNPLLPCGPWFRSPYPVPDAGQVFFGRIAFWGSISLCVSSCEISVQRGRVGIFHRWWGKGGKKQQNVWRAFVAFSWFQREAIAELWNQPSPKACLRLLSCGIDFFFGESVEVVARQTSSVRKTKLDCVYDYSELMHSVILLVPFTFWKHDSMQPVKCCRWFHKG